LIDKRGNKDSEKALEVIFYKEDQINMDQTILIPNLTFKLYQKELAPKKPCVYRLHNAQQDVIYVGVATNLKNRMQQHRSKTSHTSEFIQEVVFETYYENEDIEVLSYLEKVYIHIYNETIYNKMLNPNKDGIKFEPLSTEKKSHYNRFIESLELEDVLHKKPPEIFEKFLSFVKTDYINPFYNIGDGSQFKKQLKDEIMKRFGLFVKAKNINNKTEKVYCKTR
jgi:hypothetical protein